MQAIRVDGPLRALRELPRREYIRRLRLVVRRGHLVSRRVGAFNRGEVYTRAESVGGAGDEDDAGRELRCRGGEEFGGEELGE